MEENKSIQLTIDIDPDKIDYQKITEKILERIETADLKDIISETEIFEKLLKIIYKDKLYDIMHKCFVNDLEIIDNNDYITTKFKNQVVDFRNNHIKEIISDKVKEYVDCIDEDSIKEAIMTIAPNVLYSVLVDHCNNSVNCAYNDMRTRAFEDAKGLIRFSFNQKNMPIGTPYSFDDLPTNDY